MPAPIALTNAQIRVFWSLANVAGPNECWLWRGNVARNGYGRFRLGDDKIGAHRIALTLEGPPMPEPPNHHALHGDCASKLCVNPRHLRWGSNLENIQDEVDRGLSRSGQRHPNARLSDESVHYIRRSGELGVALARRFGVSTSTISMVRSGTIWTHVAPD